MIVPTLRVGMQPGTLRVPLERGASLEAFPRRAWERSMRRYSQKLTAYHPKTPITTVYGNAIHTIRP
ncbi:hypothetical protein QFZ85_000058 [Pseudomonas frederiksbergensis]